MSYEFYPPEKHRTGSRLDLTLSVRRIGIQGLLEDYDGVISDEAKKIILEMLKQEEDVFARPAEILHP